MAEEMRFRTRAPWWVWPAIVVTSVAVPLSVAWPRGHRGMPTSRGEWVAVIAICVASVAVWSYGKLAFYLGTIGVVVLDREGLTVKWWWMRRRFAWDDVTLIDVVTRPRGRGAAGIQVSADARHVRIGWSVENADTLVAEIVARSRLGDGKPMRWGMRYGRGPEHVMDGAMGW